MDLITQAEAATLLAVERRTLLRMEERGALTPVRLYPTAQRRYRREDVEALVRGDE